MRKLSHFKVCIPFVNKKNSSDAEPTWPLPSHAFMLDPCFRLRHASALSTVHSPRSSLVSAFLVPRVRALVHGAAHARRIVIGPNENNQTPRLGTGARIFLDIF
jgi:hypothetical protein